MYAAIKQIILHVLLWNVLSSPAFIYFIFVLENKSVLTVPNLLFCLYFNMHIWGSIARKNAFHVMVPEFSHCGGMCCLVSVIRSFVKSHPGNMVAVLATWEHTCKSEQESYWPIQLCYCCTIYCTIIELRDIDSRQQTIIWTNKKE